MSVLKVPSCPTFLFSSFYTKNSRLVAPQPLDAAAPQPLIPDEDRRRQLSNRFFLLNIGGSEKHREYILQRQFLVETQVEATLVEDGFNPEWIRGKYADLRGCLHSPFGKLLSRRTYNDYVTQIENHGVRASTPYRRILEALAAHDL